MENKLNKILEYCNPANENNWCITCALVSSLPNDVKLEHHNELLEVFNVMAYSQRKWKERHAKLPQYRPASQVLAEFLSVGKRQTARKELRTRLPYLAADEQRQIIYAFLDSNKTDREWILNFLNTHWDSQYLDKVIEVFESNHDYESAQVLCNHAPAQYIQQHADDLAKVFFYFNVRICLPKEAPIDRSRLSDVDYLRLMATLKLEVSDAEAWNIFYQEILHSIDFNGSYTTYTELAQLGNLNQVVWALGQLKKTDMLLWFAEINNQSKDMVINHQNDELLQFLNENKLSYENEN